MAQENEVPFEINQRMIVGIIEGRRNQLFAKIPYWQGSKPRKFMRSLKAASRGKELILKIKSLFAPPAFPDDEEKTRRAEMINLALIYILVIIPFLTASNFLGGNTSATVIWVDVSAFFVCLVLLYCLHQGRVGLASSGIMALGFVATTLAVASLGTIRAPATAIYLLIIITAGLLFDLRGMIASTAISSLLVGGLIIAENMGLLPMPNYSVTITQWISYTLIFGWAGSLTFSSIRSMHNALELADNELKGRRLAETELTKYRDHLEELVRESTEELALKNAKMAEDIAERKRAQEDLLASENKFHIAFNNHPGIVGISTLEEGRYIDINKNFEEQLGWSRNEVIGRTSKELNIFADYSEREKIAELVKKNSRIHNFEVLLRKKSGDIRIAEFSAEIIEVGGQSCLLCQVIDITERKLSEEALKESESKLASIIDFLPDATFVIDAEKKVIAWNRAIEEMTGVSKDYMIGQGDYAYTVPFYGERRTHLLDLLDLDDKYLASKYKYVQRKGNTLYAETFTPALYGGKGAYVWATGAPLFDNKGNRIGAIESIRDISEFKKTEKNLQESERRLTDIINFLPDATFVIEKDGRVIAWNRAIEAMTGIKAEEIIGKGDYEYSLPFYGHRRPILVDLVLEPESEIKKKYSEIRMVDGTLVGYAFTPNLRGVGAFLWGVASPIYDIQGNIVGAIESIKDVTDQKNMEIELQESKDYLDKIINSIGDPLFVKDRQHRMTLVNNAACKLWGRPCEEIIGKTAYDLFQLKEMAEISWKHDEEVFNKGIEITNEETNTYADKTLTVLVKKTPYTDKAGNQFLVGITRDITDRKQAEDKILASLHEKEILLKEVHHRVKNNLQIISALLSLQSSYLSDENLIKIFRDSQNRIKSMALVHENLYRSKDFGKIDFKEYINQLVSHLSQSYGDVVGKILFKVKSENVYLNINTAIPCGMIINELVSNSFKHAFPEGRRGEVWIDLSSEDEGFRLVVSDNGIGINRDINIKDSKTLGFRLIDTLVKQIDGRLSLDTTNGFRCEIYFKGLK